MFATENDPVLGGENDKTGAKGDNCGGNTCKGSAGRGLGQVKRLALGKEQGCIFPGARCRRGVWTLMQIGGDIGGAFRDLLSSGGGRTVNKQLKCAGW